LLAKFVGGDNFIAHDANSFANMRISQRGFTLVELVTLIAILGVISVTALPKFFNYSMFQEKAFFDDTLSAFRYAQKLAVATGCNVQVFTSNNQYQLKRPAALDRSQCASTTAADFTQIVIRPGSTDNYQGSQSGVAVSSVTVYFTAKGTATTSANVTVGSRTLSVVRDTGFVYDISS
jgi:MSHA pilin protein MshC